MTTSSTGRRSLKLAPVTGRVIVHFAGQQVANSQHALVLYEGDLPPVYYLPLADIAGDRLQPSEHSSYCPFKGQARYWHLVAGDRRADDAVWNYPEPLPAVAALHDRAAFYPDRVEGIEVLAD